MCDREMVLRQNRSESFFFPSNKFLNDVVKDRISIFISYIQGWSPDGLPFAFEGESRAVKTIPEAMESLKNGWFHSIYLLSWDIFSLFAILCFWLFRVADNHNTIPDYVYNLSLATFYARTAFAFSLRSHHQTHFEFIKVLPFQLSFNIIDAR